MTCVCGVYDDHKELEALRSQVAHLNDVKQQLTQFESLENEARSLRVQIHDLTLSNESLRAELWKLQQKQKGE